MSIGRPLSVRLPPSWVVDPVVFIVATVRLGSYTPPLRGATDSTRHAINREEARHWSHSCPERGHDMKSPSNSYDEPNFQRHHYVNSSNSVSFAQQLRLRAICKCLVSGLLIGLMFAGIAQAEEFPTSIDGDIGLGVFHKSRIVSSDAR